MTLLNDETVSDIVMTGDTLACDLTDLIKVFRFYLLTTMHSFCRRYHIREGCLDNRGGSKQDREDIWFRFAHLQARLVVTVTHSSTDDTLLGILVISKECHCVQEDSR